MQAEIARFLPLAGLFVGLIVAFAFDPTASGAAWWGVPVGLTAGVIARFIYLRHVNARR